MTIPTITKLRKSNPIPIPIKPPGLGARTLNVPMIRQEQSNWCWAACAEMAVTFIKTSSPRQCEYANWLFGQTGCCSAPSSGVCNKPCQVRDVGRVYSWRSVHYYEVNGQVAFATLRSEIDSNRPVEVAYAWNGGGGHVAIVRGWGQNDQGDYVMVNDPAYGSGGVYYSKLQTAYDQGQWFYTWTALS